MKTEKIIRKSQLLGEEYTLIRHKSGLNIYVFYKDLSVTYTILGTRYGSFDNRFRIKGEQDIADVPEGIAHFLEHKMFEMEDGRDAFELYAANGADANAYTSVDRTAYLFSCTELFEENLRILIKMVNEPYFTAATVEKEQGIIGEEIKMCEDRPWNAMHYSLMNAIYKDSPARIPVTGTIESIAEITPELLYRCHKTFYDPHNMALCICGRVDEDRIVEIVDECVSDSEGVDIERFMPEEPDGVSQDRVVTHMQVSKPMFGIGVKDPTPVNGSACHYEAVRTLVCEAIFGVSSDLYSELYESGMIGGYGASWSVDRGQSVLDIYGDSDDPEAVFAKFVEYVDRCIEQGIPEEQFVRARRVMYARAIRSFESSTDIAEELFSGFITGTDIFEMAEEIYKIEKSELDGFIRQVFKPHRYAMSIVLPKDGEVDEEPGEEEEDGE